MLKERIKKSGLKIKYIAKEIGISDVLLSYYLNKGNKSSREMPSHVADKIDEILKKQNKK